jgi:hypothetical protein
MEPKGMSDNFDFGEIARKAKADAEAAADKRAAENAAKEAAEKERIDRAVAAIDADVLPLARRAETAFATEGIAVLIDASKGFSVTGGDVKAVARLEFCCYDSDDTYPRQSKASSKGLVTFTHDGNVLTVTRGTDHSARGVVLRDQESIVRELSGALTRFLAA